MRFRGLVRTRIIVEMLREIARGYDVSRGAVSRLPATGA